MTASIPIAPTATAGKVTQTPAAPAIAAEDYFTRKLQCETDASDVHEDIAHGRDDFVLIDTRSRDAYRRGHLPGAISLPHPEIDPHSAAALPAGKLLVTYCWGPGCNASTKGARKLAALGLPVKEMIGGFVIWCAQCTKRHAMGALSTREGLGTPVPSS